MSASVVVSKLTESFSLNCIIFFVTLILALPLGLVVSFGSRSRWAPLRFLDPAGRPALAGLPLTSFKRRTLSALARACPIRWLTRTFVWIIRGTPLMLQIVVIFFVPGLLWGLQALPRMTAAIVAFVINYACYFSEIFRGGIESVPRGQYEAGQVLGMTKTQIFFKVTLIQVVKRIIPPMGNEFMTLIKDTSLANFIANKEIIMTAKDFGARGLIWPLFATGIYFLLFCGALTLLFNWLEKKLDYFRI